MTAPQPEKLDYVDRFLIGSTFTHANLESMTINGISVTDMLMHWDTK
ncbi:hypothetical protein [Yoonia sp.]|nr:hypothetical protein [Yoonia sp.]MDE0850438.1 hypothetical protein [Yoonia sp.]